jgi:hypothetical protein
MTDDRTPKRLDVSDIKAVVRALGPVRVEPVRSEFTGEVMLEFTPSPRKLTRTQAAARGTESLVDRTARRVQRTAELTADGKTNREIGDIIATEEGSAEGFAISTVKGWRRRGRGTQP